MISVTHGVRRRTQCAVGGPYGRRIRDVQPTVTPGLVIATLRSHFCHTIYSVTHRRSGSCIGDFRDSVVEAQEFAEALDMWSENWPGFWTLSSDEMARIPDAVNRIRRYLGKEER